MAFDLILILIGHSSIVVPGLFNSNRFLLFYSYHSVRIVLPLFCWHFLLLVPLFCSHRYACKVLFSLMFLRYIRYLFCSYSSLILFCIRSHSFAPLILFFGLNRLLFNSQYSSCPIHNLLPFVQSLHSNYFLRSELCD